MYICTDCGEKCEIVEETFDYSGTHCTGGLSGTHHTGNYVSACCLAEFMDESEYEDSEMHETYTLRFYRYDGKEEEVRQVTVRDEDQLKQRIHELWGQDLRIERFDEVEVS